MSLVRRSPALLALLMLGALSLRLGLSLLVALPLTLLLVVLLFIPKAVLQTAFSALLWVGSFAWAGVAWLRVVERMSLRQPWMRLVLIFGAVALFTAWSAWLIQPGRGRSNDGKEGQG